jgi:hypothetical protein
MLGRERESERERERERKREREKERERESQWSKNLTWRSSESSARIPADRY